MKKIFFVFLASFPYHSFSAPFVTNGIETSEFPAVVRLTIDNDYLCTGTIVGDNTVLTAAHCLKDMDLDSLPIEITVNEKNVFKASQGMVSPGYTFERYNQLNQAGDAYSEWDQLTDRHREQAKRIVLNLSDIISRDLALIKLDGDQTFENHLPVKIFDPKKSFSGVPITLVGFGANDLTALMFNGAGVKRMGTNSIVDSWGGLIFTSGQKHDKVYEDLGFCTEADGTDVGSGGGDSGGPILHDGAVIGTVMGYFMDDPVYQVFKEQLGATGEFLMNEVRKNEKVWDVFVSLSSPHSILFLTTAKYKDYHINFADDAPIVATTPNKAKDIQCSPQC